MQTLRLSTGAAALAVGSLAVFGMASPVAADHNCPNPAGKYPPGQCNKDDKDRGHDDKDKNKNKGKASDGNDKVAPGQQKKFEASGFQGGEQVDVAAESTPIYLTTVKASQSGTATATVTIPTTLSPGRHHIVFTGQTSDVRVAIPITVTGAGGASGTPSSLPFTGSDDLIPLTIAGAALVSVGAGVVVAARRRRSEMDTSTVA